MEWALHSGLAPRRRTTARRSTWAVTSRTTSPPVRARRERVPRAATYEENPRGQGPSSWPGPADRAPGEAGLPELVEETAAQLPDEGKFRRDFALRAYDLIQFEDLAYARRYARLVLRVHGRTVSNSALRPHGR